MLIQEGNFVIDMSTVFEVCGGDKEIVVKMITVFLNTLPGTIEKLEKYNESRDWDNLYKTAHAAKSALSIIRIPPLFDMVLTVEQNARHLKDVAAIPQLITKIISDFKEAARLLKLRFHLD